MTKKRVNAGNPALDIIQGGQEAPQEQSPQTAPDSKQLTLVGTRMPNALKDALTRIAFVERESVNSLIVRVMSDYVEKNAHELDEYERLKRN